MMPTIRFVVCCGCPIRVGWPPGELFPKVEWQKEQTANLIAEMDVCRCGIDHTRDCIRQAVDAQTNEIESLLEAAWT